MDKRIRSPNYPALSLPDAVDKIKGVYREIHTHSGPREVIAKAMGYTGLNGASATAISALHKYGLLEKNGEENRVSERAMRIMAPHNNQERIDAIKEAAFAPALFAELAERFPGKLPNEDLLKNYLVRKGFAAGALAFVVSAYRETSEMAEREGGGYGAASDHHEEPSPTMQVASGSLRATSGEVGIAASGTVLPVADERPIGRYDYEGGAYVRITASGDVDTEEALDMVETLIALKRAEIVRKNKRAISPSPATVVNDEIENGDTDMN